MLYLLILSPWTLYQNLLIINNLYIFQFFSGETDKTENDKEPTSCTKFGTTHTNGLSDRQETKEL